MTEMPLGYRGREQTWLKHRVLEEYLIAWGHKLGSASRHLWYVDCFAGPWESRAGTRDDTSIAIGLRALRGAADTLAGSGRNIALHAVFVEKDPSAFAALRAFLGEAGGGIDVHPLLGAFGDHVQTIDRLVGPHPAFIFVDPKGWDGVALRYIARLAAPGRDVLVNVMYDHLNRFKDDPREFLRRQMCDFFGLMEADLPAGLAEEELMGLYRTRLQDASGMPWVADLSVPVPARDRTNFRLVVGGHNTAVIKLFRDVERKVIGGDAAQVRVDARAREREERTGQMSLLRPSPARDPLYDEQRRQAEAEVREALPAWLGRSGPARFGELWPPLLCAFHLTLSDLGAIVLDLEKQGVVEIRGRQPRERSVKEDHVLALPGGRNSHG